MLRSWVDTRWSMTFRRVCSSAVRDARSSRCGELRKADCGRLVRLGGWIQSIRPGNGSIVFANLRDAKGIVQVVIDKDMYEKQSIGVEDVVFVYGKVQQRPADLRNPKLETGEVEVDVEKLELLNAADDKPILVDRFLDSEMRSRNKKKMQSAGHEVKLQFRHLDIRGAYMQRNLRVRADVVLAAREVLSRALDFIEVETPTLFKSTPEGAREFLVPTRSLPPGTCYALVQSPQQYKQLLMAGGIERYFQFARCYRDESGTRERQPEFTQLDLEMSFANTDHVMQVVESTLSAMWLAGANAAKKCALAFGCPEDSNDKDWLKNNVPQTLLAGEILFSKNQHRIAHIKYDEALETYGSDKPDRRFSLVLSDAPQTVFSNSIHEGNIVCRALVVQKTQEDAHFFRGVRNMQEIVDEFSSPDIVTVCVKVGSSNKWWRKIVFPKNISSACQKLVLGLSEAERMKMVSDLTNSVGKNISEGDVIVLTLSLLHSETELSVRVAEEIRTLSSSAWAELARRDVCMTLGRIRSRLGKPDFSMVDFVWVSEFPLFELSSSLSGKSNRHIKAVHHPFTMPCMRDVDLILSCDINRKGDLVLTEDMFLAKAQNYDLVCNGSELGGGSVRIHSSALQRHVFENILGIEKEKSDSYFGHLLAALSSGCPPHAGIALGVDRLLSIMCETNSITDTIAFPKSLTGKDLLVRAPSVASENQLSEYHLNIMKTE